MTVTKITATKVQMVAWTKYRKVIGNLFPFIKRGSSVFFHFHKFTYMMNLYKEWYNTFTSFGIIRKLLLVILMFADGPD